MGDTTAGTGLCQSQAGTPLDKGFANLCGKIIDRFIHGESVALFE
jgi:hypothetical protein